MWKLYEHRRIDRVISSIPQESLKRYEKWKDIVMMSGPSGLRQIKGFHDESLSGEWKKHRSSGLGLEYRVIYKVESKDISVFVIDVTAHDYRKR